MKIATKALIPNNNGEEKKHLCFDEFQPIDKVNRSVFRRNGEKKTQAPQLTFNDNLSDSMRMTLLVLFLLFYV